MIRERNLEAPILGVTTMPANFAPKGYMREQINMICDGARGIDRRPPAIWAGSMEDYQQIDGEALYSYQYNGGIYFIQVYLIGVNLFVNGWKDAVSVFEYTDVTQLTTLDNIRFSNIHNVTYMWDYNTPVELIETEEVWGNSASLNITSALNYAEEVAVEVYVDSVSIGTASWLVPGLDGNNQEDADAKRATNRVATELHALVGDLLTTNGNTYTEGTRGSNFTYTIEAGKTLRYEVSTGRGDASILVFNSEIQDPEGLVKYCTFGTVLMVKPGTNEVGAYYLKAISVAGSLTGYGEVIWQETYTPEEHLEVDPDTKPYLIDFEEVVAVTRWDLDERRVGDSTSNPAPYYVGKNIEQMTLMQDRLGILAGDRVTFSKVGDDDEYTEFWRNSAVNLLVSDATSVGTSGSESIIKQVVFHNKSMLAFADDAQFKIDGQTPITPQTVAMALTTSNDCYTGIAPVQMQSAVYFCNIEGDSISVYHYSAAENVEEDSVASVTQHIVGYIKGTPFRLRANANSNTLFLVTQEERSKLYVYSQIRMGDNAVNAWSTWTLPDAVEVEDVLVNNNIVHIIVRVGEDMQWWQMDIRNTGKTDDKRVCVDSSTLVTKDGNGEYVLPENYTLVPEDYTVVVMSDNEWHMNNTAFDVVAATDPTRLQIVPTESIPDDAQLVAGVAYASWFELMPLYTRHPDGTPREADRLRVREYLFGVTDAFEIDATVNTKYGDVRMWQCTAKGDVVNQTSFSTWSRATTEWCVPISMRNDEYVLQFHAVDYLPMTITYISEVAQLVSTRTRR